MPADTAIKAACDDVRVGEDTDAIDGVTPGLVARPRSTQALAPWVTTI